MRTIALFCILCITTGCQQKLAVDVVVTADPDANLADAMQFIITSDVGSPEVIEGLRQRLGYYADDFLRRRSTEPAQQPQPLTDSSQDYATLNELATVVQSRLNARGYVTSGDPQLLVRVDFAHGPYRYQVPEQIIPASNVDPSIGAIGSQRISTGESPHDVVQPGHELTVYASAVGISVYLAARPESPVWSGSIVTVCPTGFRGVAPLLIDELLREFPTPTGEPPQRKIAVPD